MTDNNTEITGLDGNSDHMAFNRLVGYIGRVGRRRESYCIEQLRYMRACYKKIGADQLEYVREHGKQISCGKGCDACCRNLFIGATLQECEAIAYYLQHNDDLLDRFLTRYPAWRESVKRKGDQFIQCQQGFKDMLLGGLGEGTEGLFDESVRLHNRQHIRCPFLEDNLCSIYEARPVTCAGFFVTSPPEWCEPTTDGDTAHKPEYTLTQIEEVVNDTSFYFNCLEYPVTLYAPVAVYRILEEGYSFLEQFAGLSGIEKQVLDDPEVRAILHKSI